MDKAFNWAQAGYNLYRSGRSIYRGLSNVESATNALGMRLRNGKRLRGSARSTRSVRPRYSQSRSMRRRMPVEGRGVTNQHDRQMIYRKKSMPRYKKRGWKRFKSKVNAVAEKELGSQTVVFNGSYEKGNQTNGQHGIIGFGLYTQSSTVPQYNDLKNISGIVNDSGDFTNVLGVIVKPSTKYIFKSAVLDLTMRNVCEDLEGNLLAGATLEVDIYELTVKKVGNDADVVFNEVTTYFGKADSNTDVIGGTGTGINIYKRGITPWDVPLALSQYGVKIWKKTKMFIANGQTATYQYRDPKRHVITQESMMNTESCNRPFTKHIMIIFKVVPGFTPSALGMEERLIVGCTRKYLYKVEGNNEDRDRLIVQ